MKVHTLLGCMGCSV